MKSAMWPSAGIEAAASTLSARLACRKCFAAVNKTGP